MSASGVGVESFLPNLSGVKSSGDLNVAAPPSNWILWAIGWSGSGTTLIKTKPARQARGGVSFDTRIFAYWTSKRNQSRNEETPTPFRFPCVTLESWRYFRPWAAPCNYCRILVDEVTGKAKSRTSSSLLVGFFLMYFMTFPWTIHSATETNRPSSMSS